ncbi:ATP phosphoribosyltransferase [candidate division MSBL1 archaeon SCGC-AAA261C02]|uniref:ATP phosphoribosyltransferase n=1 Tax=candidate division MSBL1 archaeon SCGC-AAA261C02 TaxID=1698272 RepID=A0A133V213_9EURY|nr:ATP phosphoribosyltransferase [candidate division MSBL1 archaeon SCGC-AAA261C02]
MNVKLAIPNKGRLCDPALELLEDSGIGVVDRGVRQLFANTKDPELELVFVRTQDIPNIVAEGAADLGITGYDLVRESGSNVEDLLDLEYGKARMVVAAQESSLINSVKDVQDGSRVATEFSNITRQYFEDKGVNVEITKVSGATEATPSIGVADLIVDLTSTGTTLRTHDLQVIDTLFETSARLIANPQSLEEKREKIAEIKTALESVIRAKPRKLILLNVPKDKISAIKEIMPGMAGPTVSKVEGTDLLAIQVVVKADEVYELVKKAKDEGARDILIVPIERILP